MHGLLLAFARDEGGSTSTEYALVAALMAVTAIGAARALGTSVSDKYALVSASIEVAVT